MQLQSVLCQLYLWHDYNTVFKIKHKFYIATPPPQWKIMGARLLLLPVLLRSSLLLQCIYGCSDLLHVCSSFHNCKLLISFPELAVLPPKCTCLRRGEFQIKTDKDDADGLEACSMLRSPLKHDSLWSLVCIRAQNCATATRAGLPNRAHPPKSPETCWYSINRPRDMCVEGWEVHFPHTSVL